MLLSLCTELWPAMQVLPGALHSRKNRSIPECETKQWNQVGNGLHGPDPARSQDRGEVVCGGRGSGSIGCDIRVVRASGDREHWNATSTENCSFFFLKKKKKRHDTLSSLRSRKMFRVTRMIGHALKS